MAERGVVYAATGPKALREVVRSVRSLRDQMPGCPAFLFCDESGRDVGREFDSCTVIEEPLFRSGDKIRAMAEVPLERAVFLDADTFVCGPFWELFDLLDRFDWAATWGEWRRYRAEEDIPLWFPVFSSGMTVYARRPEVVAVLREWDRRYRARMVAEDKAFADQLDLRAVLWESALRVWPLGSEWHCHIWAMAMVGGNVRVRIAHGHRDAVKDWGKIVNRTLKPRLCFRGEVRS